MSNFFEIISRSLVGINPRHKQYHLSLLPPGPDEVHERLLHGVRLKQLMKFSRKPLRGNSAPHKRISGKGHR